MESNHLLQLLQPTALKGSAPVRAALSASDILPTLNPPQQGHLHPLRRALVEAALLRHLLDGGQVVRIRYGKTDR
ncbi:hypothetical protein [Nocardia sp. SC052]|uniref:hypothetical protein n=1 Tax=Nocardia sichangensis TaxID=3385975 RepID=UPI0039A19564